MGKPVGFSVAAENVEWCNSEIQSGRYETFAEIVDFSMRLLLLEIHNGEQPLPRRHGKRVRKTVRINQWVLESLMETGFFDRSDVVDYAIWALRVEWDGEDSIEL